MIKRATTWFIAAFSFVFLSQAQAKLPFNAFKNVSKHFNNLYYSPVLGMSALESGIVKSIRFAFVEQELTKNGNRIFLADAISNPHGHIAKILFPSVTGELGIDTNAQVTLSNFATSKFMATIMAVTSRIRQLVQTQPDDVERFTDSVWDTYFFKATGSGNKQQKSGILAEVTMSTNDRNKLKKQVTELFTQIRRAIIEEEQGASLLPKYSVEQLISAFVCTKLNTRDELEAYLIDLYPQDSQRLIFKDLSKSSAPSAEGVFADISLFNQRDAKAYVEQLQAAPHLTSEPISSSSSAAASSGPFSEDTNASGFLGEPKILDALYAVTVMPYFSKPTPYINDAPSHGPAGFVEGVEATVNPERGTFSDCNENSVRVLLNLMIFDASRRQFNLAFLEKARGPRVDILKEFYTKYQDVTNVGATSLDVRTQWNRVVGDLNSFLIMASPASSSSSSPATSSSSSSSAAASSSYQDVMPFNATVRYLQGNNELDSGFANILRVFEKVFGLSLLPSFPETGSIEEKEAAIRQGFIALFKFIAPGSQVALSFKNSHSKPQDLAGEMIVTVNNKFEFTLFEGSGTHGHVENIKSLIPRSSSDQKRLALLEHFETALQTETIASFVLMQENKKKLVNNAFYNLFSKPIYGNKEALSFLEKLANMPVDVSFNFPLKFVLKQVAWDDPYSRLELFKRLESLLGRSYDETIFEAIRYFKVSEKYPISYVEATMKNLSYIEFSDDSYVNIQNIMPTIREIYLPKNAKSPLDLSKLPNLESLHLYQTQIPLLNFTQPMLNLIRISLPATITDWSQVKGIEYLSALEGLNLDYTKISSLEFPQPMPHLKHISFPRTLKQIQRIENLPALERMNIRNTQISSLEFTQPMPNLKIIDFPLKLASLTGIENLQGIQDLYVGGTQITSFEFAQPMPNLKNLILPATITDWSQVGGIENLSSLKELILRSTKITSLDLTKPLPNLKKIVLPDTTQSCTVYGKKENWRIKLISPLGLCIDEWEKHTICVNDPSKVRFSFLGDGEGTASTSTPPN